MVLEKRSTMFSYNKYKDDLDVPGTTSLVGHEDKFETDKDVILVPQPSDDPNDPLNWSSAYKYFQLLIICVNTLITAGGGIWTSTVYTNLQNDLPASYAMLNTGVGIQCVMIAVGGLLVHFLSVSVGRRIAYLSATACVVLGSVIFGATPHYGGYIAFCVVNGLGCSTMAALVEVSISDIFFVHEHGKYVGAVTTCMLLGTTFGPAISGYVEALMLWNWCNWIVVILSGAAFLLELFFLEESLYERHTLAAIQSNEHNEKVLLEISETFVDGGSVSGRKNVFQRMALVSPYAHFNPRTLVQTFLAPLLVLRYPAIAWVCLINGLLMFWLNWWSVTVATYYGEAPYNFSLTALGNLNYAGLIGVAVAMVYLSFSDRYLVWRVRRNGGVFEPEFRLDLFWFPTVINTLGVGLYGFSPLYHLPWVAGAAGIALINFGQLALIGISCTFMIESHPGLVVESMLGMVFVKYVMGAVITWVLEPWQDGMGLKDMTGLIVALSIIFNLGGVVFVFYGKNMRRASSRY